jgi:hypothetical protein
MTDVAFDLADPSFASIRAQLAKAFMATRPTWALPSPTMP